MEIVEQVPRFLPMNMWPGTYTTFGFFDSDSSGASHVTLTAKVGKDEVCLRQQMATDKKMNPEQWSNLAELLERELQRLHGTSENKVYYEANMGLMATYETIDDIDDQQGNIETGCTPYDDQQGSIARGYTPHYGRHWSLDAGYTQDIVDRGYTPHDDKQDIVDRGYTQHRNSSVPSPYSIKYTEHSDCEEVTSMRETQAQKNNSKARGKDTPVIIRIVPHMLKSRDDAQTNEIILIKPVSISECSENHLHSSENSFSQSPLLSVPDDMGLPARVSRSYQDFRDIGDCPSERAMSVGHDSVVTMSRRKKRSIISKIGGISIPDDLHLPPLVPHHVGNNATNTELGDEADDEDDMSVGETRDRSPLCYDRRIKSRESTPAHAIAMAYEDENTATVHGPGEIKLNVALAINTLNTFPTSESKYSQSANDKQGHRKTKSDTAPSNKIEGRKVHDGTNADMTPSDQKEDSKEHGGTNEDLTSSDKKEDKKVKGGTRTDMAPSEKKENMNVYDETNADMMSSDMKTYMKVLVGKNGDRTTSEKKEHRNIPGGTNAVMTSSDKKEDEKVHRGTNADMTPSDKKEHRNISGGTNADITPSDKKEDTTVHGGSNAHTAPSKRKVSYSRMIKTQTDQKKCEEMNTNVSKDRHTNTNLEKFSEKTKTGIIGSNIGYVKFKHKESKTVEATYNVKRPGRKASNEYERVKTARALSKSNVDTFGDRETTDRYTRHAMSISFPAKSVVPTRERKRKGPSLGVLSNEEAQSDDLTEPPLTPREAFSDA